jgi:hypothetical protein
MKNLLILSLVWALPAQAMLFSDPLGPQVGTLPAGRTMFSYIFIQSDVSQSFGTGGEITALESRFNRSLPWQTLINADRRRGAQLEGLLRSHGVNPRSNAGQIDGSFSGSMRTHLALAGVGITDRIGLFAALPIIRLNLNSATAFSASDSARHFTESLRRSGQSGTARDFESALNTGFRDQMRLAGYSYQPVDERLMVGDLTLLVPIQISDPADDWRWVAQGVVVAPTGSPAAIDDLYQVGSGDGRWWVGARGLTQVNLPYRLSLRGLAGARMAFADERDVRVPLSAIDELRPTIARNTRIVGGEQLEGQIDLVWQATRSWMIRSGWQSQYRFRLRYDGGEQASLTPAALTRAYGRLSNESDMSLHTWSTSLEFRSIQAFLDGDFPIPVQAQIAFTLPVAGQGNLADWATAAQLSLFF